MRGGPQKQPTQPNRGAPTRPTPATNTPTTNNTASRPSDARHIPR